MSLREIQQQYSTAIVVVAGVVLLGSLAFILWWFVSSNPTNQDQLERYIYFYDLNKKELIEVVGGTIPPIDTDSGDFQGMPAGVRAHVFCCGPRLRDTELFVGYLEVPVAKLPEKLKPPGMPDKGPEGEPLMAIRSVDAETWHDPLSSEGMQVMNDLSSRCTKELKLTPIHPPPRKK
jgi:hypothetical protein